MARGAAAASIIVLASLVAACSGGGTATPSVAASVAPSVAVAPSFAPSIMPSVAPSATPSVAPSVPPSVGPAPSPLAAGTVVTIEVPGKAYVRLDESPDNKITTDGDALEVETVRGSFMSTRIGWDLPPGSFAPGTTFSRIDMKLCGTGTGDFWETYAPSGGEPLEQEVTQPAKDGCWHFDGAADGDPYFEAFVNGDSKMRIDRIVYTLTVG